MPEVSLREYAKMCNTTHRTIRQAVNKGAIREGWDETESKIITDIADQEWGLAFRAKKANKDLKKSAKAKEVAIDNERLSDLANIPVAEIKINPDDIPFEAERKFTIIKAQRELLKLKTESGELVNKGAVYKELFGFGIEVRAAFQNLPDRIIDRLISLSRNDAHKLLSTEIELVLTKLSEYGKV